jgi:hypothetical protein
MSFKFFTYWPDSLDRPGRASIDKFIDTADLLNLVSTTVAS